ncbi:hypothetical protein CH328_02010 [Mycoplasmopsis bovis]|uniref:Uncharacterized protein n=2 Tax=Mycoplasmopsis bovis TaxID=28903 RepID=A0A2N8U264_MYCBV|nr:hypothetical protein [Mycoplasmopsis bovis]AFM51742.1 Hypothetical protein Mbov_0382 [Mycoplasmopsis bovis HB0801]AIA33937.1 hypothetical protein K668_01795 [Mycoplasmopsis bovis CQ-W70]AKO50561.1 hypothetical protein AAV31_01895 [Mycoplasmopsis bovis]AQU85652.1 hypothetical protein B0W43_01950 [Mycoplasmopsis bovis]ATQ40268.1 hypothetical protein B8187_01935 [Mycoplasmopsis bovis]
MKIISNLTTDTFNFFSPVIFTKNINIIGLDKDDWKENTRLKFDARLLAISTRIEKFDNKKIRYGIYIETNAAKSVIEFNAPLVFKKLPQ